MVGHPYGNGNMVVPSDILGRNRAGNPCAARSVELHLTASQTSDARCVLNEALSLSLSLSLSPFHTHSHSCGALHNSVECSTRWTAKVSGSPDMGGILTNFAQKSLELNFHRGKLTLDERFVFHRVVQSPVSVHSVSPGFFPIQSWRIGTANLACELSTKKLPCERFCFHSHDYREHV